MNKHKGNDQLIEDDSEDELLNLVSIYRDESSAYSLTSCSCLPFISNDSKNYRMGYQFFDHL